MSGGVRPGFAALARLVRADARFSFPAREVWYGGLDAFRRASDKHAAPEVVHWDRPELFEAFGLPMSFPPSRGFD